MCGTQIKIVPIYFLEPELKVLHKSKEPPKHRSVICTSQFRQFKWLISAHLHAYDTWGVLRCACCLLVCHLTKVTLIAHSLGQKQSGRTEAESAWGRVLSEWHFVNVLLFATQLTSNTFYWKQQCTWVVPKRWNLLTQTHNCWPCSDMQQNNLEHKTDIDYSYETFAAVYWFWKEGQTSALWVVEPSASYYLCPCMCLMSSKLQLWVWHQRPLKKI